MKIFVLAYLLMMVIFTTITLSFAQQQDELLLSERSSAAATAIKTTTNSIQQSSSFQPSAPTEKPTVIGAIKRFKLNLLNAIANKINRIPNWF